MEGDDRLQIIFTNSLGGNVWSQFGSAENFGSTNGQQHAMLTARTVMVPGRPLLGGPSVPKPESLLLREFELTYTVDYNGIPNQVQAPLSGGGTTTTTTTGVAPVRPLSVSTGTAPPPCQQL